jgi:Na+/melibiose symporter-like transporter
MLIQNITAINERLDKLNASTSLNSLDKELAAIEKGTVPLTQQAPYTLLMMRVVEIGLPVVLSIASFLFLLRYSLTEARSHEIKGLLKQRSQTRTVCANS